jgi:hypothetical protein
MTADTTAMPSRFAPWQEANQVRREEVIDEYLAYLSRTRVRVRNVTDLADLVARHISQTEEKPCSKSTLLRNLRYKAKLLSHQARHLDAGVKKLDARAVTDPISRALLTSSQLEAGNLKRELDRLNIYVKFLENQQDQLQCQTRQRSACPNDHELNQLTDYEFQFIRTCQALRTLLSHLNVILEVDPRMQCIRDKSKRRDNIIVDKDVAGPFFEWLARAP